MRNFLRSLVSWPGGLLRRLLLRLLAVELTRIEQALRADLTDRAKQYASAGYNQILEKVAALQALDVSFRDTGKIILIARVNQRDYVQIIDIPAEMTLAEWKERTQFLAQRFGAKVRWVDAPMGTDPRVFKTRY